MEQHIMVKYRGNIYFICIIQHFGEIGIILERTLEAIWMLTGIFSREYMCILSAGKETFCFYL
jgi:hypothetical protein